MVFKAMPMGARRRASGLAGWWPQMQGVQSGWRTFRGMTVPCYNGNPETREDLLPDWEDFADEVMGSAPLAQKSSWALQTFPPRLHGDLKADPRDKIRSGQVLGEVECVDWLEDEKSVDAPNQKLDDLWNIPSGLEPGELRLAAWRNYLGKYRRKLRMVED